MGCFGGSKRKTNHSQSQIRFLEEQNLELASALNEWQALVRQLQAEQAGFKQELANQAGVVEQHVQALDQQGAELDEARAQCHEVKLLWEASVQECSQLDSQLAAAQQKVSQLEERVEDYANDKVYLTEALEKREKALRMAEQVMDMVDLMQTPTGSQDATGFNWGGEDMDAGAAAPDSRASAGISGLLKGVLGGGLDDTKDSSRKSASGAPSVPPKQPGSAQPAPGSAAASRSSFQAQRSPERTQRSASGTGEGLPGVQRSQSPDMRNMGLRHSIQATKLMMAQSRTSGQGLRRSSAPLGKHERSASVDAEVEHAHSAELTAGAGKGAAAGGGSGRSSSVGGREPAKSKSAGGASASRGQGSGSARSSSSSSVGVSAVVGKQQAQKTPDVGASRNSSARSSSRSVSGHAQGAVAREDVPDCQQERTPNTSINGAGRGSGVLDTLVGSVVYDAMGPSPIHSNAPKDNPLASSVGGTQAPPARSLEPSLQGLQQDGSAAAAEPGSGTAQQQHKAAPGKVPAGSLAQAVAAAMHSPEGGGGHHREWLQQQQQQLGGSSGGGCASMTSSTGSVASHSHRGSDQDTPLLRYQGAHKASAPGAGASLAATAAAQQQQQQQGSGGLSARKGPSVRGPTVSGRPSPLKLGPKSNAAAPGGVKASHSNSSSREDVVRDADQAKLAAA